jgi:hypothetical protein
MIDYTPEERDPLIIIAQLPLSTELIATPTGQVYTTLEFEKFNQQGFPEKLLQYFHRAVDYREALAKYFGLLPHPDKPEPNRENKRWKVLREAWPKALLDRSKT